MKFEVSERMRTASSQEELLVALEAQFKKVSEKTQRIGQTIEAKSIEASFGSANRADTTIISVKPLADGCLVVADVNYRPSVFFWIILIVLLFTWVFWLVPIVFYIVQKNAVRTAIAECLQRVKNEFDLATQASPRPNGSAIEDLEKLGALKEKGFLTESEFEAKKKQLLGI